ncbi:hypothetical protein C0993_008225, partial [Termitomyces sp. T159_Od127]
YETPDDGGTRGLSELLIIEELMNRIKYITNASVSPKPCEYFDMIGGVGTGGLIALMLGRLKMPIDQAIKEYVTLCSRVFSDKKWQSRNEKFKASVFEASMEAMIKSSGLSPDALLQDDGSESCKNFVVALPAPHMTPRLFHSYTVGANQSYNCTIVTAARATTANPGFFKPVVITDGVISESFIGGNFGYNNPSRSVLEEAESVFGHSAPVACLVSIGAGKLDPPSLQKSDMKHMLDILSQIAADSEKVAEELENQYIHVPDVFFRLNVEQGLQKCALDDWKKLSEIKTHTLSYLLQPTIRKKFHNIVQALHNCPYKISVRNLKGPLLPGNHIDASMQDIYQIPAATQVFRGRKDILERLNRYFATDSISKVQKRYVLYGLGGAGKTQIVLQFVALYGSRWVKFKSLMLSCH